MKTSKSNEETVINALSVIGENPNREGLKDTPKRAVKIWQEIFRGYDPKQKSNWFKKVARIVDYYSTRLQFQERLVKDVVNELEKNIRVKKFGLGYKSYTSMQGNGGL